MPSMGEHVLPTWHSLSAREIAAFVERDPVVVLPLASIEQHGPHLPLSTDLEIGLGILRYAFRKLPTDFPACALPSQWVGASTEHLSFPGTLSIDPDLLTTMVVELGRGLSDSGVRRLVLSNSHGGNRGALDAAGLRLRREEGLLVVKASHGLFPPPETVDLPESEWRDGIHGGAIETSMMLYLRPELVHREEFRNGASLAEELARDLRRLGPETDASFSWLAEDLNPAGVVGDPRLANEEQGRRLVEYYGSALAEVIQDARAFPLERLS